MLRLELVLLVLLLVLVLIQFSSRPPCRPGLRDQGSMSIAITFADQAIQSAPVAPELLAGSSTSMSAFDGDVCGAATGCGGGTWAAGEGTGCAAAKSAGAGRGGGGGANDPGLKAAAEGLKENVLALGLKEKPDLGGGGGGGGGAALSSSQLSAIFSRF